LVTFFLTTFDFFADVFFRATGFRFAAFFREAFVAGLRFLLAVFFAGIFDSCRSEKNAQLYIAAVDMEASKTGFFRRRRKREFAALGRLIGGARLAPETRFHARLS
jgi:hypothetical protein